MEKLPEQNQFEVAEVLKNERNAAERYNFPEIMEKLKPAMISLVRQLKDAIEKGEYQTLISDDARGRIPTLILRGLFKNKAPNAKDLQTYFLAFGRGESDNIELASFIASKKDVLGKVLIVTEFIHEGNALRKIYDVFETKNQFTNYDIATSFCSNTLSRDLNTVLSGSERETRVRKWNGIPEPVWKHNLIVGQHIDGELESRSGINGLRELTGVKRRTVPSINTTDWTDWIDDQKIIGTHPDTLKNITENPEPSYNQVKDEQKRLDKYGQYGFGKNGRGYQFASEEEERQILDGLRSKMPQKQLTTEEAYKIQKTINSAREDVDVLVDEIIKEVWKD